jgi:hypothetical protein
LSTKHYYLEILPHLKVIPMGTPLQRKASRHSYFFFQKIF